MDNNINVAIRINQDTELVAEKNPDADLFELIVGIRKADRGIKTWCQDLCIVREEYYLDEDSGIPEYNRLKGRYEVLVYANHMTDDWTSSYQIGEHHGIPVRMDMPSVGYDLGEVSLRAYANQDDREIIIGLAKQDTLVQILARVRPSAPETYDVMVYNKPVKDRLEVNEAPVSMEFYSVREFREDGIVVKRYGAIWKDDTDTVYDWVDDTDPWTVPGTDCYLADVFLEPDTNRVYRVKSRPDDDTCVLERVPRKATYILWDFSDSDVPESQKAEIPTEVDIPDDVDDDEVSDWLSDMYHPFGNFCHLGFVLEYEGAVRKPRQCPVNSDNIPELLGNIIDIFEDFLDDKNIVLENPEKDEAAQNQDPDTVCNIYGDDYGILQSDLERLLLSWGLIEDRIH